MNYSLGNMLSRGGALNPYGLSLDLAFAADKTLTARRGPTPTFTRASTATFVGSDGLIQSAAINTPRFDHDPVTLACKGLLIEELRTNLIHFTHSSTGYGNLTTPDGSTVTDNFGIAPDGTQSTIQIADNSVNFAYGVALNINSRTAFPANSTVCASLYIRKKTSAEYLARVQLTFEGGAVSFARYNFNYVTGAVTAISNIGLSGLAATVTDAGAFWRLAVTASSTVGATVGLLAVIPCFSDLNGTANPALTGNCEVWGHQVEVGSFPTSLIPTYGAALTRSADVCSISGTNFTSFYNQSEGTVSLQATSLMATATVGNRTLLSFTDGSYTNQQGIYKSVNSSNLNTPIGLAIGTVVGAITQGVAFKVAVAFQTSNSAASFNGGAAATVSSAAVVGINRLEFRDPTGAAGGHPSCHIARIQYFKKRLPNAKLQSLTTA